MISLDHYRNLAKKNLTLKTADGLHSLTLEVDSNNRCFRLRQKSKKLGHSDFDHNLESELRSVLGPEHYLERVIPSKPFHSYLLIDAITLQALQGISAENNEHLPAKITKFEDVEASRLLQNLVAMENNEMTALAEHQLDRANVDRRVWLSRRNHFKTCIDRARNIYIYSEGKLPYQMLPQQDLQEFEAFKKFVKHEAYIRLQKNLLPIPGNPSREFSGIKSPQAAIKTHGVDDSMAAIVGSKHPLSTPPTVQALAIFPLFLSIIASGVSAIKAEAKESSHELDELEEKIAHSKHLFENILIDDQPDEQHIKACLHSLQELNASLNHMSSTAAKIKTYGTAVVGQVGAITMFSAIASYEIQAVLQTFCDLGYDISSNVTSGYGSLTLGQYGSGGEKGVFSLSGTGMLIGGELMMMAFVLSKIISNPLYNDFKQTRKISKSENLSDLAKEIAKGIKKDKMFLNGIKLLGNMTTLAGQAIGLSPISNVGMALAVGGIAIETTAEIALEKRHDFEQRNSEIEEAISQHYLEKMVKRVLEFSTKEETQSEEDLMKDAALSYSQISHMQACTHELLFHLTDASLVMQKILKEGHKGDFFEGAEKARKHYSSILRWHQPRLLKTVDSVVDAVVYDESDQQTPRFNHKLDIDDCFERMANLGEYAYKLFHKKIVDLLNVSKDDAPWLIEVGALLSTYKTGDLEVIRKMADVQNLPDGLRLTFRDICNRNLPDFTYKELISNIQIAFLVERIMPNISSIMKEISSLANEDERAKELNRLLLADEELKSEFVVNALNEVYKKENSLTDQLRGKSAKQAGKYDDKDNFISVVGKVLKPRARLFGLWKRPHMKTIYSANEERLPEEDLSIKVVAETLDYEKYLTRSDAFIAMTNTTNAGTYHADIASKLTATLRKKPDPHTHPEHRVIVLDPNRDTQISSV